MRTLLNLILFAMYGTSEWQADYRNCEHCGKSLCDGEIYSHRCDDNNRTVPGKVKDQYDSGCCIIL